MSNHTEKTDVEHDLSALIANIRAAQEMAKLLRTSYLEEVGALKAEVARMVAELDSLRKQLSAAGIPTPQGQGGG